MRKHIVGYAVILCLTLFAIAMTIMSKFDPGMKKTAAGMLLLYIMGMASIGSIYAGIYIRYMWFVPFLPLFAFDSVNLIHNGTIMVDYGAIIPFSLMSLFVMLQWALIAWGIRVWRNNKRKREMSSEV